MHLNGALALSLEPWDVKGRDVGNFLGHLKDKVICPGCPGFLFFLFGWEMTRIEAAALDPEMGTK